MFAILFQWFLKLTPFRSNLRTCCPFSPKHAYSSIRQENINLKNRFGESSKLIFFCFMLGIPVFESVVRSLSNPFKS